MNTQFLAPHSAWIAQTQENIRRKLGASVPRVARDALLPPYTTENGKWVAYPNDKQCTWWTNGFWAAMMWQMYLATGDAMYQAEAERNERVLDIAMTEGYEGLHHDVGFMWHITAGANYRITGNRDGRRRALHAANLLAGRFNPNGFIRAWNGGENQGWAIIDCMMNIPLLYWASRELKDPRYEQIAITHAETSMDVFIREDGSSNHIVVMDPTTGDVLDNPAGQGCASGSSWTRGQAWALYGFALSYIHTQEAAFLNTAKQVAHYFLANLSEDGVPVVDFRAPELPVLKDATAGAIAACGLIEIARHVPECEAKCYLDGALRMLRGLDAHSADWTDASEAILQNGTERYRTDSQAGVHIPIVYGDYFFVEAIHKLAGLLGMGPKGIDTLLW